MPILVYFLARFGIVTAKFLVKQIRYAILIIFIIAAVITPSADIATQIVFAAPMMVLYVISIGVAWVFGKAKPKEQD
jgi:sec-independent protein translocase protein TatC